MWESVFGWMAVGAGLLAAVLWLQASLIRVDTGWDSTKGRSEPFDRTMSNAVWTGALMEAATRSGQLNAWAAGVTAGAALLQAASLAAHQLGR